MFYYMFTNIYKYRTVVLFFKCLNQEPYFKRDLDKNKINKMNYTLTNFSKLTIKLIKNKS